METPSKNKSTLIWVACVAVILFCGIGIGAIMGWIPTSSGQLDGTAPVTNADTLTTEKADVQEAKPAEVKKPAATVTKKSRTQVATSHASPPVQARCLDCGTIESIRQIDTRGEGSGLGVVGGAVVGGLLGHQVGDGRGRDVATIAGAVGGGYAGNQIEKRAKSTKSYDVTVRMEDGTSRVIHQADASSLQLGDHVKVVDDVIRRN